MKTIEKPVKKIFTLKSYMENLRDGDIRSDQDVQRMAGQWNKNMTNELIYTVLTDDYIPPIIIGEDVCFQKWIIDGLQRSTSLKMFRFANYKITSSIKNSIVKFRKKVTDKEGNTNWEYAEFDIRGKTYDLLPKELQKKFDEFQVETVIHEKCTTERISELVCRYNNHKAMNPAQKAFTYIKNFARKIRNIYDNHFFVEHGNYTPAEKINGTIERIIMESIMCMFHISSWKSKSDHLAEYLDVESSNKEFEKLNNNLSRLDKVITKETNKLFNSKDSFIWFTLFDKFTNLHIEDNEFNNFLICYLQNSKMQVGLNDINTKSSSTKDKKVVIGKINYLENIMHEFFHVNKEEENLVSVSILKFVQDNVGQDIEEEDIKLYEEMLDDLSLNVDNTTRLLEDKNRPALIALIAYSCRKDIDLDRWFIDYFERNKNYIVCNQKNYINMRDDLEKYMSHEMLKITQEQK